MTVCCFILGLYVSTATVSCQDAELRSWSDKSGSYSIKGDLVAWDETNVVLQNEKKELVFIAIDQLSQQDRSFLNSQSSPTASSESKDRQWELKNGLQFKGRVIEYGKREVRLVSRGDRIYVNDKRLKNLPDVYQQLIPRIVGHFENVELDSVDSLLKWISDHSKNRLQYECEGVMMELPNGDMYGIPFFLFSERDQSVLRPAYEPFENAEADERESYRSELELRSKLMAERKQELEKQNLVRLHFQLQAVGAGLTDLWEVNLFLPNGYQRRVVVAGRDSLQARDNALAEFPNATVGTIAKVRRSFR